MLWGRSPAAHSGTAWRPPGKTALFLSPYWTQKANLFLWVFHEKWEEVPFPLYFSRRSLIIGMETDFGFSEII